MQDTFTGNNLPNAAWGHGKLNAFDAFFVNAIYGCTDTGSINYNADAQFDDGSCIAKVRGCMDPNAINYNSNANVADSCEYYFFNSLNEKNKNVAQLFPNPTQNKLIMTYYFEKNNSTIEITDVSGSKQDSYVLKNAKGVLNINTTHLSSGMYFINAIENGKTIYRSKFVKQ